MVNVQRWDKRKKRRIDDTLQFALLFFLYIIESIASSTLRIVPIWTINYIITPEGSLDIGQTYIWPVLIQLWKLKSSLENLGTVIVCLWLTAELREEMSVYHNFVHPTVTRAMNLNGSCLWSFKWALSNSQVIRDWFYPLELPPQFCKEEFDYSLLKIAFYKYYLPILIWKAKPQIFCSMFENIFLENTTDYL